MCVRICQCNHCHKRGTCTDCKYQNEIKEIDCLESGVQNCAYYVTLLPSLLPEREVGHE